MVLGAELQPQRACGNGETVDINRDGAPPAKESLPALALPSLSRPEAIQGSTTGFGFRDTGSR
jgi:hypothetical protein